MFSFSFVRLIFFFVSRFALLSIFFSMFFSFYSVLSWVAGEKKFNDGNIRERSSFMLNFSEKKESFSFCYVVGFKFPIILYVELFNFDTQAILDFPAVLQRKRVEESRNDYTIAIIKSCGYEWPFCNSSHMSNSIMFIPFGQASVHRSLSSSIRSVTMFRKCAVGGNQSNSMRACSHCTMHFFLFALDSILFFRRARLSMHSIFREG